MHKEKMLEKLNAMTADTLMHTLGIVYTDLGEDYLVATMPVNSKVHQPMGLLHGGASVALAESVASAASLLFVDPSRYEVRGIEISANHLKSKKNGELRAIARIVHKGRTTHLWEVRIEDEEGTLISLCKQTNIVLAK
jgi:uncharacterized protein (TIGR00369 family)